MRYPIKSNQIRICELPFPMLVVNRVLEVIEISNAALGLFEINGPIPKNAKDLFTDLPNIPISQFVTNKELEKTIAFQTKTQQLKWLKLKSYPSFNDDQELYYFLIEDITVKKLEDETNKQGLHLAKVGSWRVDLVNGTLIWSAITREIHEVNQDYVPTLESGINFYKEGEHRDRVIQVVSQCIEDGTPYDEELLFITANGNEKWIRTIGHAERINGKTLSIYGVFQDINQRKLQELALERERKRLYVATHAGNIGIWEWDLLKNDLYWSPVMHELYDVNKENFVSGFESWQAALHPLDLERTNQEVTLAIEGKKPFNTVFRIIKPNGSTAYIHGQAKVFTNANGQATHMIGVNTDITQKKQNDQHLKQLVQTTEDQNKKLIDFAYIVSHNIRSSSSNISMLTGMLLSNIAPQEKDKFLQMMQKSSDQLEETLNDLNEVLQVQIHQKDAFVAVPIAVLVKEICLQLHPIITKVNATIINKIPTKTVVFGIKNYMVDIITNLISNSLKYKDASRPLTINISIKEFEDYNRLTFKDNGLGIDLERYGKQLFGMYKTFHGHSQSKGVGLFINKNQMEAMNGRITVESKVGKGSTFHLIFPHTQCLM